jgi:hypothetical protein
MLPIEEADDKKDGIRDEDDLIGKVQGVPQTDYLLSGNFGREHIKVAKLGKIVTRSHGDSSAPHFPSRKGLDFFWRPDVYIEFFGGSQGRKRYLRKGEGARERVS